jgi:hypothetical protein
MKYYEPFQRLDHYVYVKADNAVYIRSSVSVLLPAKASLLCKEPVHVSNFAALLNYVYIPDDAAFEPYIFEANKLIRFLEMPVLKFTDPADIKKAVSQAIVEKLGKTGTYSVTCIVYNAKNVETGQVTNTISQQGEVIVL